MLRSLVRAIALALMLVSAPTGSFRDPGEHHDRYLGTPSDGPAFLAESRKPSPDALADPEPRRRPSARPRLQRAHAPVRVPAAVDVRLLPHATGPPLA